MAPPPARRAETTGGRGARRPPDGERLGVPARFDPIGVETVADGAGRQRRPRGGDGARGGGAGQFGLYLLTPFRKQSQYPVGDAGDVGAVLDRRVPGHTETAGELLEPTGSIIVAAAEKPSPLAISVFVPTDAGCHVGRGMASWRAAPYRHDKGTPS